MTLDELVALTRSRLAARERRVVPPGPLIRAAVLVPLVDRAGGPHLVFAKRTETVGTHRGQISFPGGTLDPADASLLDAALRECEEEVGLPRAAVEPLGALDDTETVATQFVITPWVGVVREPIAWRPDGEEIEKVIEVPLAALVDPANVRVELWERQGVLREIHFFDWGGETIWGATARILRHYLDLVLEAP
ncbi:MAG: CoA pyrophosphatase [Candidatus Rokubacteria bacterium]|nr:CoA pyrophosphatase [Candidatus Rokubacteria bacterium]MBI4629424.1 CoA pyrophosphatase [Candidatus Rokubacteria bacterium]